MGAELAQDGYKQIAGPCGMEDGGGRVQAGAGRPRVGDFS